MREERKGGGCGEGGREGKREKWRGRKGTTRCINERHNFDVVLLVYFIHCNKYDITPLYLATSSQQFCNGSSIKYTLQIRLVHI